MNQMYVCACVCMCVHACVRAFVSMCLFCLCVCLCMCARTHMHTCDRACVRVCVCVPINQMFASEYVRVLVYSVGNNLNKTIYLKEWTLFIATFT